MVIHPGTGSILVLEENAPRILIELFPGLNRVVSVRRPSHVLPGGEDISGIAVDPGWGGLWIVNDTERAA